MEMQSMTEDDYARTLNELDRLLNDPDVPLHAEVWHVTADMVAQIGEAMTRSLALLGRLKVEREAKEMVDRWMDGPPFK